MQAADKHVHTCPQCGGEMSRVHRHVGDRIVGILQNVHRYRCGDPDCGWEGIVSRPHAAHSPSISVRLWLARVGWMFLGAAIAIAGVAAMKVYRSNFAPRPPIAVTRAPPPLTVPSGESFDGFPLAGDDVRVTENPTDLTMRRSCAWGVPGRNPYKGTVTQALAGARVPEEVIRKVNAMVEHGLVSDRVVITSDSIHTTSGKRRFDTTLVSMAFGKTLCFGARVNFHPGHVEMADLYDATDSAGTNFAVMVPYVCGNVSVLAERGERRDGNGGGTAPEPGTLASLLAAATAMAIAMRLARQRAGKGQAR